MKQLQTWCTAVLVVLVCYDAVLSESDRVGDYEIEIERHPHVLLDGRIPISVEVKVNRCPEIISAYDLVIAWSSTALCFQRVIPGDIHDYWRTDSITYELQSHGDTSNAWPNQLIRVSSEAPQSFATIWAIGHHAMRYPFSLFKLEFSGTDDRTWSGWGTPIRFYWLKPDDNSLTPLSGNFTFVESSIHDYRGCNITDHESDHYPAIGGVQEDSYPETIAGLRTVRDIDFVNGLVRYDVPWIEPCCDIDINEICWEASDALLYADYFLYGAGVFDSVMRYASIAMSDCNKDGITLSLADLVFCINREIINCNHLVPAPDTSAWNSSNGVYLVEKEMAACYLVVAGHVQPRLLIDNMYLEYRYDGTNTRILVWCLQPGEVFSGEFLRVRGELVSIEFATPDGAPVVLRE